MVKLQHILVQLNKYMLRERLIQSAPTPNAGADGTPQIDACVPINKIITGNDYKKMHGCNNTHSVASNNIRSNNVANTTVKLIVPHQLCTHPNSVVKSMRPKFQTQSQQPVQGYSLFWCFYIMHHTFETFKSINSKHRFGVENTERFRLIDVVRSSKFILKEHKIKHVKEIESELSYEKFISMNTFVALCAIYSINSLIIDGRVGYENIFDKSSVAQTYILERVHKTGQYRLVMPSNANVMKMVEYANNYFVVPGIEFKLKSVSGYTLPQLIDMTRRLQVTIPERVKITKSVLYDSIINQIV